MVEQMRAQVAGGTSGSKTGGGIRILGTERHEARRIDNQLRGRGHARGDPAPRGSTSASRTI